MQWQAKEPIALNSCPQSHQVVHFCKMAEKCYFTTYSRHDFSISPHPDGCHWWCFSFHILLIAKVGYIVMTHHKIEKQKRLYNNGLLATKVTQPFHFMGCCWWQFVGSIVNIWNKRPAWFLGVDKKVEKISANGFYKTPWLLQLQLIAVGPVLISILI